MPSPARVEQGFIVGGQPSESDLEAFAAAGYALVINLRPPGEFGGFDEEAAVHALGMEYVNIPVRDMEDFTRKNATQLHAALERAEGPVLLHCTVGARAGALLGVERYLFHGFTRAQSMQLASDVHMHHLEENVERALDRIGSLR